MSSLRNADGSDASSPWKALFEKLDAIDARIPLEIRAQVKPLKNLLPEPASGLEQSGCVTAEPKTRRSSRIRTTKIEKYTAASDQTTHTSVSSNPNGTAKKRRAKQSDSLTAKKVNDAKFVARNTKKQRKTAAQPTGAEKMDTPASRNRNSRQKSSPKLPGPTKKRKRGGKGKK